MVLVTSLTACGQGWRLSTPKIRAYLVLCSHLAMRCLAVQVVPSALTSQTLLGWREFLLQVLEFQLPTPFPICDPSRHLNKKLRLHTLDVENY